MRRHWGQLATVAAMAMNIAAQAQMKTIEVSHSDLDGIGVETGVMRRDPSDVIKVGDLYYVWYSKGKISPGYDATVWYATSPNGHVWTERGMSLAKGKPGTWEGASVFTPNILVAEGRYWLFYTGTSREYGKGFNPDSKIGIAVSDSPDGPWERLATNPALRNSDIPSDFDSHLVDDACLVVRDGKYWCYYKGRQLGKSPAHTQMGLAIADHPQGPYVKHEANPVIPGNHEVLVWPQGTGVAAMIGSTGPKHITNTIQYAEDGVHFSKTHDVKNGPWAGGAYRPEAFTQSGTGGIPEWGVEIGRSRGKKGALPFIQRFDLAEEGAPSNASADAKQQPTVPVASNAEAGRPNFVAIFTDDQGYADLGCYGGRDIPTPHKEAYQDADYAWLKGSQHDRAKSTRAEAAPPALAVPAPASARAPASAKATADRTAGGHVTIESLLTEMVDRDAVARYPEKGFRLKQHSSYNRASKTPDDPKGWFANGDYNRAPNGKNFIRTEENDGQREWVLMDHRHPGAIVRTWMPWHNQNKGGSKITMRIYLDGADEPALEGNMLSMFDGSGVMPYPFAHPSLRSAVNFFPIPYAKSCKVTTDQMPFFFQFTFREYEEGTPIKTFTMADFQAAQELMAKTGKMLLNPSAAGTGDALRLSARLGNQEEKSLDLPAGTAAVRELSVKLGSYEDPNVTRQVVLQMEFDGKETVWCPIGDFFGSGIGLNPMQGWYRTVAEDGTMSCRWVMPYQKGGKVSLLNLSGTPVDAELVVKTGEWIWDERSMVFHAGWRGQYPVPTRPRSDWNYVTLQGRGVYVGDTLTIMNPETQWWGEGDEKIWVDGEDFPSIFGTGTEDYYGYSWGGVSTDFYEHPFHAQPRAHVYNKLHRKTTNERNTQGYSTETRTRSLDTMPFGSSLRVDMEVWSGTECDMGYAVGMYWYGFADTSSNRRADPQGALLIPPLPDLKKKAAPKPVSAGVFKNAVECESMDVVSKTGNITLMPQNLKRYEGRWSGGAHVLFKGAKVGDEVVLRFPATRPVAQALVLYATKSYDFGVVRFTANGKPAGADVDLYAPKPIPSGPIELGVFEPVDGAYILRAEVVDRNPRSKGTLFGLDCVQTEATE